MANYQPPTEDTGIFNGLYFTGTNITTQNGDGRYLKLLAQGDEDMNNNDILNVNQLDTNSVKFSDNTIQTTAFTGVAGVPTGTILPYAGSVSIPSGYLLADGSSYATTLHPALYQAIGLTYGAGGLPNTFRVPNLVDNFIMGGAVSAGATGGSNQDFITGDNITPFPPSQAPPPNAPANTTIAFNTSGGIGRWRYIKGEPTGDGSQQQYYPYANDDNANGANLIDQLAIGTGTTAFDKKPSHYVMIYMIKT